jgi:histidyl-tRNA synthetase
MGYYTGQIFEISHSASSSSIAGGGRYDKLIGRSLGRDVPACGFSIGFERIIDLINFNPHQEVVAVLFNDGVSLPDVLATARSIREQGRTVSTIPRSGKLASQLDRLEAWGFTSFIYLEQDNVLNQNLAERPLKRATKPDS